MYKMIGIYIATSQLIELISYASHSGIHHPALHHSPTQPEGTPTTQEVRLPTHHTETSKKLTTYRGTF
jgi:hypothetical protein